MKRTFIRQVALGLAIGGAGNLLDVPTWIVLTVAGVYGYYIHKWCNRS